MSNEKNESGESEQPAVAPKIIVDSDWKEQVAKEKQAAVEPKPGSPEPESAPHESEQSEPVAVSADTTDADTTDADTTDADKPARSAPSESLPEPTFEVLVSMLFTQAISALGQMPSPIDGETRIDKPMAKHSIDMLDMLSTKTKGNLTDTESKMLGEALHMLRMAYVNVRG